MSEGSDQELLRRMQRIIGPFGCKAVGIGPETKVMMQFPLNATADEIEKIQDKIAEAYEREEAENALLSIPA